MKGRSTPTARTSSCGPIRKHMERLVPGLRWSWKYCNKHYLEHGRFGRLLIEGKRRERYSDS